jgi:inorganic triphosphatase YgiF
MELKKGDAAMLAELAQRLTKASGLNYAQVSKVATAFKNLC